MDFEFLFVNKEINSKDNFFEKDIRCKFILAAHKTHLTIKKVRLL